MKVTDTTPKIEKQFEPITISITLESANELRELFHRIKADGRDIAKAVNKHDLETKFPEYWDTDISLYRLLQAKLKEANLYI